MIRHVEETMDINPIDAKKTVALSVLADLKRSRSPDGESVEYRNRRGNKVPPSSTLQPAPSLLRTGLRRRAICSHPFWSRPVTAKEIPQSEPPPRPATAHAASHMCGECAC